MPRRSSHILELARKGAEARFRELMNEANGLVQAFPQLRDSFDADELPIPFILKRGAARSSAKTESATPPRRRRGMSAAQRQAVSARMKKYWASRRAAKKK